MKAAVLHNVATNPIYQDFPDPMLSTDPLPQSDEALIIVKAASIKNLDKMRAKGTHYDQYTHLPAVVGMDGVGVLEDGTRVYTGSKTGMMAEKAIVSKKWCVPVPDGLDDVTAAALPNPAISAWLSLISKGPLKKEDAILILGATGITGRLAVQLARHLGAGKVVAVGRNASILDSLPALGADTVISLNQPKEDFQKALKAAALQQHFTIVLDYLWGEPAEWVLEALTGHDLDAENRLTHFIQVGEMAGPTIRLNAAALRSSAIQLSGSGGGSIPKETLAQIPTVFIPEVFRLAAEGKLTIATETAPLKEIATAWQQENGRRMVVLI